MAGVRTRIEDRQLVRRIKNTEQGIDDATTLMQIWGRILKTSVSENFEVGGRPKRWRRLKPATIKRKGHNRILIGRTGNLSSMVVRPHARSVTIGTQPAARKYAATHQFGREEDGIPQRRFLLLHREDRGDLLIATRQYVRRIARA